MFQKSLAYFLITLFALLPGYSSAGVPFAPRMLPIKVEANRETPHLFVAGRPGAKPLKPAFKKSAAKPRTKSEKTVGQKLKPHPHLGRKATQKPITVARVKGLKLSKIKTRITISESLSRPLAVTRKIVADRLGTKRLTEISTAKGGQSAKPRNLHEQLLLKNILLTPESGVSLPLNDDPRFKQSEGWQKKQASIRTIGYKSIKEDGTTVYKGTNYVARYQYNNNNGKIEDIKFIGKQ
ncbi:hypothetical protein ACQQ2Q_12935 [Agrobacterium sp. ES01]|uniref:hypothetical protein n=1 Tax=Agrobacterium sp. ES01 TaxID=3420714 RepID=UPI003D09C01F